MFRFDESAHFCGFFRIVRKRAIFAAGVFAFRGAEKPLKIGRFCCNFMDIARMLASLPMYDWPEIRASTDAWWAGIARHAGLGFPLTRAVDYAALWRRDDLAFSQTCGYPFTHGFAPDLRLVATPHYDAEGCVGPEYLSFIFARQPVAQLSELARTIAAVNTPDSMSGMLALKLVFGPFAKSGRFFRGAIGTGGHVASLQAVRHGTADVCAVDAVCVALARRYRPDYLDGLVEIARSPSVPGLPYVTSAKTSPDLRQKLRVALAAALDDPALAEPRAALLISGMSMLAPQDYQVIVELEQNCNAGGGLDLM